MNETWITPFCPHCRAKNWVCLGDLSDCTGVDIDAMKCWKCERKSFLDFDSTKECRYDQLKEYDPDGDYGYDSWDQFLQEGAICRWGKKNPDDPHRLCN